MAMVGPRDLLEAGVMRLTSTKACEEVEWRRCDEYLLLLCSRASYAV